MKKFFLSKKIIILLLMFLFLSGEIFLTSVEIARAQGEILPKASSSNQPIPEECRLAAEKAGIDAATYCGNYELNDFISLAINVSRWILGIVGSLTLLMFIWGGIILLASAGASEKIAEAKKTMVAAVIGLLIVFGSYLIIRIVMASMGRNWEGEIKAPTPLTTNKTP